MPNVASALLNREQTSQLIENLTAALNGAPRGNKILVTLYHDLCTATGGNFIEVEHCDGVQCYNIKAASSTALRVSRGYVTDGLCPE